MSNDLESALAAVVAQDLASGSVRRGYYKPAFMLARADVAEAIAAGFRLKTIWEHMRETGRIPFRYETFLKYVHKYITSADFCGASLPASRRRLHDATTDDPEESAST